MTDRVLTGRKWRDGQMTVKRCAEICGDANYRFFGVEYSDEYVCLPSAPSLPFQISLSRLWRWYIGEI